jgi:demethoxyubiquinone hydroxylase (CLK1/Coq7/Cat5 family)
MEDGGMSSDIDIIRPEMRDGDVRLRIGTAAGERLKRIRRGLRTLHTLEVMAVNIYRCQITGRDTPLDRALVAAMCNEMTHAQDFLVKLYEYGMRPSGLRWAYWIVGFLFGAWSRLGGDRSILRMGTWVETKAVRHYAELLEEIEWDEDTRRIIEKNQADEIGHVNRWKAMLG